MIPSLSHSVDTRSVQFVEGSEFSSSFTFRFGSSAVRPHDRLSLLRDLVSGRRVIDFGCADHLPQIASKVQAGQWAHGVIRDSAAECLGLDIDADAVAAVNETLGFEGALVFDLDVDEAPAEISGKQWDYLVLGEVLEHISNPARFLSGLDTAFPNTDRLIVTVPNALRAQNFFNAFRHREQINSDHRFWFTPFTMTKILREGGWQVESWEFCEAFPTGRLRRLRNLMLSIWPAFSTGLIAVARRCA